MKLTRLIVLCLCLFSAALMLHGEDAVITVNEAFIKSSASSFSSILERLIKDNVVTIIEKKESWLKVETTSGTIGYLDKAAVMQRQSFTSYKGFAKTNILTTAAAARSKEKGAGIKQLSDMILYLYTQKNKDIAIKTLTELENTQRKINALEHYAEFREQGKLGEHIPEY